MPDKPTCVVAHTNKGRGISFMQDRVEWHHKVPNREQYEQARKELEVRIWHEYTPHTS